MTDATNERRRAAAAALAEAQRLRTPCAPVTEQFGITDDDAYAIQQLNVRARTTAGATRVGWKVGLTSGAIQEWLKVDEPDYGTLTDDMVVQEGLVDTSRLLQPRAEGELAFVLDRDLAGPGVDVAKVLAATRFIVPAIEIIDSRIAEWKISWADTVADNASSGLFVLGTALASPREVDLRLAGMALRKNGRVVSTGAAAACLGNPANAVAWLSNKLAEQGERLRAGDVVLSGALGPVTPVDVGDWLALDVAGVGTVTCSFV